MYNRLVLEKSYSKFLFRASLKSRKVLKGLSNTKNCINRLNCIYCRWNGMICISLSIEIFLTLAEISSVLWKAKCSDFIIKIPRKTLAKRSNIAGQTFEIGYTNNVYPFGHVAKHCLRSIIA